MSAPEVEAVIESWVPYSGTGTDAAMRAAVMPAVREMVAAVGPETPQAARRLLWALAPMAVWLHRSVGVFSAAAVNHDNVEAWISQVNATREPGWRDGARAALRAVGAAVDPQGWPRQREPVPRQRSPQHRGDPLRATTAPVVAVSVGVGDAGPARRAAMAPSSEVRPDAEQLRLFPLPPPRLAVTDRQPRRAREHLCKPNRTVRRSQLFLIRIDPDFKWLKIPYEADSRNNLLTSSPITC